MASVTICTDDSRCFACSPKNEYGLQLTFECDEERCWTRFVPHERFQGWMGITHGGIVATVLDETMAQWLWHRRIVALTAEMQIRFAKPVPVGRELLITAVCRSGPTHGLYVLEAAMTLDGETVAKARGKFLVTAGTG